jgi:hypothetical protein
MPAAIRLMPPARMDQVFAHPGPSPEALTIQNEQTPENLQSRSLQDQRDAMEERIRLILAKELTALKFRQKGDLAAYWTDVWGYSDVEVAERLSLSEGAVRKTKFVALRLYPCGNPPGTCHGAPNCAHRRGEELWNATVERIIVQLEEEGEAL